MLPLEHSRTRSSRPLNEVSPCLSRVCPILASALGVSRYVAVCCYVALELWWRRGSGRRADALGSSDPLNEGNNKSCIYHHLPRKILILFSKFRASDCNNCSARSEVYVVTFKRSSYPTINIGTPNVYPDFSSYYSGKIKNERV